MTIFPAMRLHLASILVLWPTLTYAQNTPVQIGGRATGMATACASLKDNWALYNNPAGSARLTSASVNFACERQPGLIGANRVAVCLVLPSKAGTFSAGAFKFGDNLYSEHLISFGYSHHLGLAAMGARIDYIQYRAEGFDPVVAAGITAGTIADITEKLSLGGYVSNINRPTMPDGTPLPIRMAIGFAFRPTDKVVVCGELEKDTEFAPTIKAGIEVSPLGKVHFRSGFSLYPSAAYAGLGLRTWRISIDYSTTYRPALGVAHLAGITFSGKEKRKQ